MTLCPAAVTGVGAVTPLGVGAEHLQSRWLQGNSGIEHGVGVCRDFDPTAVLSRKASRRMHRFAQLAVLAAQEAIEQAWGEDLPYPPHRIACYLGSAFGGTEVACEQTQVHERDGADAVWTLTIPVAMANAAPALIALRHGLQGESFSIASACAAGAQAIGAGMRALRLGDADAVVVGGADACVTDFFQVAFRQAGALSASGISRPFDRRRDGFVMGEAAGILVLEHPDRVAERGGTVLGHVAGFSSTTDAHHLTAPDQTAGPSARAIRNALADAGVKADDVDYVNAHGTSTPANDRVETEAIKLGLGPRAYEIPVSAPKCVLGHSMGAAGAVEAITALMALRDRKAQPTIGLEEPEDGLDLAYVRESPVAIGSNGSPVVGISNSFAFGGHNVTVVLTADG